LATYTIDKDGGGDYTSISAFESDTVANDIGEMEDNGTDYDETNTFAGASNRTLRAKAGHRHDGTWNSGGVEINPSSSGHIFTIGEDDFTAEGIVLTDPEGVSSEGFRLDDADGFLCDRCIFRDFTEDNQDGIYCGNFGSTDTATFKIKSCLFYNIGRFAIQFQNSDNKTVFVHNCTGYKCNAQDNSADYGCFGGDSGYNSNNSTMHCDNVLAIDANTNGDPFQDAALSTLNCTNCGTDAADITDGGAADISGNQESLTDTDEFVSTSGTIDLHLKSGATSIDNGTDLSSDSDLAVTLDIDSVTITGTYDKRS
jgi:hypothetical protein